jgi:hypothetical protein
MFRKLAASSLLALLLIPGLTSVAAAQSDDETTEIISLSRKQTRELLPILSVVDPIVYNADYGMMGPAGIQTSVIDLNGDGQNEVIFFARGSKDCIYQSCPVVVAEHTELKGWTSVLTSRASQVSVGGYERDTGYTTIHLSNIGGSTQPPSSYRYVDGTYIRDFSSIADMIEWSNATDVFDDDELAVIDDILKRDMGQAYFFMKSATSENDTVIVGRSDLNGDDVPEWFMMVDAVAACVGGCPIFVYREIGEDPIYAFKSAGRNVGIEASQRPGSLKSIYMPSPQGGSLEIIWNTDEGAYRAYALD